MAFELLEGSAEDLNEMATVCTHAFQTDGLWKMMMEGVPFKEQNDWNTLLFLERYSMPDIALYKIVEKSSGKLAGWAALQFPWSIRPLSEEEKKIANADDPDDIPPPPTSLKRDIWLEMCKALESSKEYGYDPETDFHRRGTIILPEFQKMGHGTRLSLHCNEVANKVGCKTWLPARPTSKRLFERLGYKELGEIDAHLERFGGISEEGKTWVMVREPHTSK